MFLLWVAAALAASAPLHDVTTPAARRQNLLEYVASRDDLTVAQRQVWQKAVRLTFGGAALTAGTDEGITAAKSVVSAAVFYGVGPTRGVRAAYEAYYDVGRWVPPPVAIDYQVLAFEGRKPTHSPRELAFHFPRYFNEELAPDLVAWWARMLQQERIPSTEVPEVERALRQTRRLMRPMLLDRLWQGAQLEARLMVRDRGSSETAASLREELVALQKELDRSFAEVASRSVVSGGASFYRRYARLAKQLHQKPRAAPGQEGSPKMPARARAASPGRRSDTVATAPDHAQTSVTHSVPRVVATPDTLAEPGPGGPLVRVPARYVAILTRVVHTWIGTPYLWGGTTRRGVDCSGFVRSLFRQSLHIDLPRNSRGQFRIGVKVARKNLRVGDMVFFDTLDRGRVTHVGVYLGHGIFVHASSSRGVIRDHLDAAYYRRDYVGGRRILAPY